MNRHNILTAINTIEQRLEYIKQELDDELKPSNKEKAKLEFEAAINFIKAKVLKYDKVENNDVFLIRELQTTFSGRWGKNVLASLFKGIAREDPRFRLDKHGESIYLVKK
jgi:hypothetical protein